MRTLVMVIAVVWSSIGPASSIYAAEENRLGALIDPERWDARQALAWIEEKLPTSELTEQWRIRLLPGAFQPRSVAISADGSHVIACDLQAARVWAAEMGELVSAKHLQDRITCGALSAAGDLAAVGHANGDVLVWDTASGEDRLRLTKSKSPIMQVAIDSTNRQVYFANRSGILQAHGLEDQSSSKGSILVRDGDSTSAWEETNLAGNEPAALLTSGPTWVIKLPRARPRLIELQKISVRGQDLPEGPELAQIGLSDSYAALIASDGPYQIAALREPGRRAYSNFTNYVEIAKAALTQNAEQVCLLSTWGIEARLTRYPMCFQMVRFAGGKLPSIAQADFCPKNWTAVVLSDSSLALWKADRPPECNAWRLAAVVHRLLERKQYDQLEELADLVAHDGDTYAWSPAQTKYRSLEEIAIDYPAILSDRGIKGEYLAEWREAAPKSKLARIASAQQLIDQGWAARGDNFAFAVDPKAAETFEANLEQARQLVRVLVDEDDCPPEAYTVFFEVAKGQGWMDALLHRYIERLLANDPAYFMPHLNLSEKLMPRWGGAPEDCINHAEKVAKRVGGDAGEMLYARMAIRLLPYHNPVDFWRGSGFDYERVQRALAKRLESQPNDSFALTRGAMLAFDKREHVRLKTLVEQLNRSQVVPEVSVMFKPFQLYFLLQAAARPPMEDGGPQ